MLSIDFLCRNLWILVFYDLILGSVAFFWISPNRNIDFFLNLATGGIIGSFITASILTVIRGLLLTDKRKLNRYLAGAVTSVAVSVSTAEIWILFMLGSRFSDRILRLILDTNPVEAGGFLREEVLTLKSLAIVTGFLMLTLALYDVLKMAGAGFDQLIINNKRKWASGIKGVIVIFFILGNIASWRLDAVSFNMDDSISRLITVSKIQKRMSQRIRSLEDASTLADGVLRTNYSPPKRIIWIIGESDNKAHSQLYGYSRETNPYLMKLHDDGNMLIFEDVICYAPWTIDMMNIMFSPSIATDPEEMKNSTPLVPMILRKAGYTVRMFDNQGTLVRGIGADELGSGSVMNSRALSEANFNYRNSELAFFDGDFLQQEKPILNVAPDLCLDIIHLQGMHTPIDSRSPGIFKFFTDKDYSERTDLTESERQKIADYDNAVRYVDSELKMIYDMVKDDDALIIYSPDHSELICDVDHRSGRTFAMNPDPELIPYYMSIPMYLFTTPKFRSLHADIYQSLEKAKDKKFSTLYFSHFLLDIAGVESKYRRPEYSPASADWSAPPRMIWTGEDYDNLMTRRPRTRTK